MEENYTINKVYFDELLDKVGKNLVGRVMKRFEIIEKPSELKSNCKELIYEEMRNLKALLSAHSAGYEQVSWKFNTKGKEE